MLRLRLRILLEMKVLNRPGAMIQRIQSNDSGANMLAKCNWISKYITFQTAESRQKQVHDEPDVTKSSCNRFDQTIH